MHGIEGHPVYDYAVGKGLMQALTKDGSGEYINDPDGNLYADIKVKAEGGQEIDMEIFGEASSWFDEIEEAVKAGDASQFAPGGETPLAH